MCYLISQHQTNFWFPAEVLLAGATATVIAMGRPAKAALVSAKDENATKTINVDYAIEVMRQAVI